MSNESIDTDTRERGGLTKKDRAYLRKSVEERERDHSRQIRSITRKRIRQRARDSLRDFRLLANHLPTEEREKIFEAIDDPRSDEYRELRGDVQAAIEFLYTGMGGSSGFRHPLVNGVRNGELARGEAAHALDVAPQFTVDKVYQADARETTDIVEAEEWNRLTPSDLSMFLRLAHDADAIDFEAIRWLLDQQDLGSFFGGKKKRAIPGGKSTPWMDHEVYEREGIEDMSVNELTELFDGGYSGPTVYDGEKVMLPPLFSPGEEPEIVEWIHGGPDDETEG